MPEESDPYMYIVCTIGWEYNDEYYYRSESEGVNPVSAFTLKEMAEEHARDLDIKDLRMHLGYRFRPMDWLGEDWRYDLGQEQADALMDKYEDILAIGNYKFGVNSRQQAELKIKEISDDRLLEMINDFGFVWHEVVAVPIVL